jgi:hypothetical protein
MRNKLDENDLVLKWPLPIREGIKISSETLGIVEVTIEGETEITSQMLEQMRKNGYIFHKINTYTLRPEPLNDIQNEDDVSSLLMTSITFRKYQAPPLENGGKSDRQVMKLRQTGTELGHQRVVRSSRTVGKDHDRGDDMSR